MRLLNLPLLAALALTSATVASAQEEVQAPTLTVTVGEGDSYIFPRQGFVVSEDRLRHYGAEFGYRGFSLAIDDYGPGVNTERDYTLGYAGACPFFESLSCDASAAYWDFVPAGTDLYDLAFGVGGGSDRFGWHLGAERQWAVDQDATGGYETYVYTGEVLGTVPITPWLSGSWGAGIGRDTEGERTSAFGSLGLTARYRCFSLTASYQGFTLIDGTTGHDEEDSLSLSASCALALWR